MTIGKKLFLTAAACALLFNARAAMAAPADNAFGDTGRYRLGDPDTFRLLSGMGVPVPGKTSNIDWTAKIKEDKAQLAQLFPNLSDSDYYAMPYSGCRTTSPLDQLQQRTAHLGAEHPYIHQWLAVERVVMSVCDRDEKPKAEPDTALPSPLATTDKSIAVLQAQDRAYQQAALLFYQNKLPEALAGFRVIAADKTSIDRPQAAFMVVAIQAGSIPGYGPGKPMVATAETQKQIQAILADPTLKDAHAMAAGLIGWLGYNIGDEFTREAQIREAITALMMSTQRLEKDGEAFERYAAASQDITFLHGRFEDPNWVLTGAVPTESFASAALARLAKTNPMAAWVAFPTDPYRSGNWAVISQLRQSTIVADYLGKMGGDRGDFANPWVHINPNTGIGTLTSMVDQEIQRLNAGQDDQAAAALSFDLYNLERQLLMSSNKEDFAQALQRLKEYPAHTDLYREIVHDGLIYLIAAGRLDEARRFRDTLMLDAPAAKSEYSPNVGALMVLAEDEAHLVRAIDILPIYPHAYVNALTAAELWRLADNSDLDHGNRALFARAAWTREYAQSRTIDWRHDQLMRLLNPEVTAHWRSHIGRDVTPDDRLVLGDVLKSPAMNMVIEEFSRMPGASHGEYSNGATSGLTGMDYDNHNDNNWWCGWEPDHSATDLSDALASDFRDRSPAATDYGFVPLRKLLLPAIRQSILFRNMDSTERQRLDGVTCAPKFLADRTIAWVEDSGPLSSRDGQAEALADVVVTTRWGGNRQGNHSEYSRHAYDLLRKLFPDSPAVKRTRYWFN